MGISKPPHLRIVSRRGPTVKRRAADPAYRAVKSRFPRHVLLFRSACGEQLAAFHDDAESLAIATRMPVAIERGVRVIRFSAFMESVYVAKLLHRGYPVAIVEYEHLAAVAGGVAHAN